jgi:large subunit ribosomal protein L18
MDKKESRLRRARRARSKIKSLGVHRLCIHRTPRHTYAQVIAPDGSSVVASASTLEADVKANLKYAGNVEAATKVGQLIAERAKASGIDKVAFDRSGFKYHGRVKALADAARESGLQI